jgi:hypothetical protein
LRLYLVTLLLELTLGVGAVLELEEDALCGAYKCFLSLTKVGTAVGCQALARQEV